ncbi:MAG TPA: FMN reductase [Nocardioidaceae bacterium]|nr:FMN reductase [Nocardioidaceae bacterium]
MTHRTHRTHRIHRTLVVVTAGLSQPSSTRLLGDRIAAATSRALAEGPGEVDVEVIELREHAQALASNLLTGFPSDDLRTALDSVLAADGLIVVTPIFNGSYSGLFKMFFDCIEQGSLNGKPVLLAATGGSARHSLALEHTMRPMFAYLRAITAPTAVFAATEDWGTSGSTHGALAQRVDRAGTELARLVAVTEASRPADPFEDITSFEELLAG